MTSPTLAPTAAASASATTTAVSASIDMVALSRRPHPGLTPEQPVTAANRVLEMRLYWGETLLGINHYAKPRAVTIGESKKADVFLNGDGLPCPEFPLCRYIDDDYVLTVTRQMAGEVEFGGQLSQLQTPLALSRMRPDDDLADSYTMALAPESRAVVHWGGITFALRFTAPSGDQPRALRTDIDLHFLNVAFMALFFHVALVVTLLVYPYDTESLREDLFGKPDRFVTAILDAPKSMRSEDIIAKVRKEVEAKRQAIVKEQTIKKALEPPKPNKVATEVFAKIAAPRPPTAKTLTQIERSQALRERFSGLFNGPRSTAGLAGGGGGGGGTLTGSLAKMIGTLGKGSATDGMAGSDIRGGVLTGGGVGTSRDIGPIDIGGPAGRIGRDLGPAGGSLGSHQGGGVLELKVPSRGEALPAAIIKRVIDDNRLQIRFCYEQELQRNQELQGRVLVRWVIWATSDVAAVTVMDSTLKSARVESCLCEMIKAWKFPSPAGGGNVTVNYPFVFAAT